MFFPFKFELLPVKVQPKQNCQIQQVFHVSLQSQMAECETPFMAGQPPPLPRNKALFRAY